MAQKTIRYGIAFDVDQMSLNKVMMDLKKIMNTPMSSTNGMSQEFNKTKETASQLYQILQRCYNQDLGSLNVMKFNQQLKSSKITLSDIHALGPSVFNRLGMSINSAKLKIKEANGLMSNLAKTMTDSLKWSMAYGLINKVSQSLTDAVSYVKELDTSLNDIRIVTNKSASEMSSFAKEANKAAITLGSSTKAYADASLIYYQQGLSDVESKERARITTMASNVTGQSASEVSEQLTAIWNGYKVDAAEAELYIDKVAKVAAQTGADLEELATGMSKVASAANVMGVDVDQLNAQLATVITVTRQAPESVGTAFKTIYSRINAIEAGSEDAETSLKQYTADMKAYGFSILDANGKLRDTGEIIEEIGGKWGKLTKEQQVGLAQVMAGQRQYNNLLALFENWDMYTKSLNDSANAAGTLQEQQDIYMQSTEAHIEQMEAKFEKLYSTVLNTDALNTFYDFVGNIGSTFDNIFSSFGGGLHSLVPIIISISSLFSKNIANGIYKFVSGIDISRQNLEVVKHQVESIYMGVGKAGSMSLVDQSWVKGYQTQLSYLEKMHKVRRGMTQEAQNEVTENAALLGQLEQELQLTRDVMNLRGQSVSRQINEAFGLGETDSVNIDAKEMLEQASVGIDSSFDLASYEQKAALTEKELESQQQILEVLSQNNNILRDDVQLSTQEIAAQEALNSLANEEVGIALNSLNSDKNSLKIQQEELSSAQKQLETAQKKGASNEKIKSLKQKIESHQANIKKLTEEIAKKENQVKEAVKKSVEATERKAQSQRKAVEAARELNKEVKETADGYGKTSAEAENLKSRLDASIASANKMQTIASATMGVLGSMSSLAMGWSMVSSITKTLNDDTASLGDKITQIVLSASMGIPMILNGLGQLRQSLGYETSLLVGLQNLQIQRNAARLLGVNITKQTTAAELLEQTIETNSLAVKDKKINLEALEVFWEEKGAKTKEEQLAALFLLTEEEAASIGIDYQKVQSLKKLKEANDKVKTSMLSNPVLLAVMVALAATLGVVAAAAAAASKKLEKTIELNQKIIDEENAYQEQIKANGELYNSYMELYQAYEKTGEATEEFKNKQQELIDLYKIELTEIEKLTLGYDGLQAKIWEARKAEILGKGEKNKGLLGSAQKELGATRTKVLATARDDSGYLDINGNYTLGLADPSSVLYGYLAQGLDDFTKSESPLQRMGLYRTGLNFAFSVENIVSVYDQLVKNVENYEEYLLETGRSFENGYEEIIEWLEKMKPAVEAYKAAIEDVSKYSLTEIIFNQDITGAENLEEFASKYNAAKEALKEKLIEQEGPDADLSDERIEAVAQATFTEIDEAYSDMISDMKLAEEILNSWNLGPQEKQKVSSELYGLIESIPESDKVLLIQMGLDKAKSIDEVKNIIDSLNILVAKNKLDLQLGYTNETIKTLQEGKELTEEQIANLQELEANYEDLAEAAAEVGRESEEYLAVLKEIREVQEDAQQALNASNYKILKENAQKKRPKPSGFIVNDNGQVEFPKTDRGKLPNLSYDTEEVEEYTDALLEANAAQIELYKSSNLIFEGQNFSFNDLVSDLDDIETYAEKAAKAIGLIGEGFLVAASDVQELLTLFPELAEQSDVLATGELQLNKEVTEAVIGGKNEISKATLNNLLVEIEANRMKAEADLQLVTETLNNFDTIERGERKKVLNGLTANDEYVTQVINDSETVVKDVVDNNKSLGEQTVSMYQAMEAAADDYGKNTAQILNNPSDINAADMYSVQTYEAYLKSLGGASAPATSNSTKDGTRKLSDLQLDPEAFWAEIDKTEKEALESWQTSLREIIAEYTQQESTIKDFLTQLQNIGTGKDGKDAKTPDELELFDPEIDEYRDIDRELEDISREREKLSKKSEHLTGEALIQNLEEQNRLLEKQNKKIQEKIGLLKKEANTIKNDLSKGIQVGEQNIEVTFDEEGNITNFTSALIQAKEAVNALELEYNAARATATEAELEALKEQIDKAKEMYEMLAELMERYDEIMYSEIPDMEDQFDENLDQIIENNIKKFNVKIEIELDAFDLETKFRDLQRKIKYDEDNPFDLSEIAEDKIGQLEASSDLISKLTDHVNSLMGNRGVYGDHTQEYLDDLKKYTEELMSNLEDVEELIDEIKKHFIELLESAQEAFDDQIANYEALAAQLEHDIALLDLLNGEERNFAEKQAYYDKQAENYKSQLAFQKQTISFWQEQLSLAEEGTEAYNVAKENLLAGIEDLNATLEEAIENAQEAHINSIKAIFEELENQVTGGKGLSLLESEWEHIKDLSDDYYDNVNRAYELSKLEANYQKALEETDSVSAQNMINAAMQQELEMLKQKEKLSKYDIDRANLKYQLTMKQIALEDAQKNKSTMRLKRDANGNYSYQYVADQSGISEIEQQIADLNNQIHNLDVQEYNRTLDEMLQYWREYQEAMIEAAQINDPEERAKVEEEIKRFYSEKFTNIERDNQNVRKNLNENATQYIKDLYGGLGDYQVNDLLPTIVAGWDGSVQQMIDFISGEGGFEQVCLDSWAKIDEATKTYQQTVDDLAASAGVDLDNIRLGIDNLLPSLQGIIDKNSDIIDKYGEEIGAMRAVMGVLDEFIGRYNSVRSAAMSAAEAAVSSYRTIANAASANNSTYDADTDWARAAAQETVKGNHYSDELTHRTTKINSLSGFDGYDNNRIDRILAYYNIDDDVKKWVDDVAEGKAFFTDDWQQAYLGSVRFNTGGYTGSWANGDTDGKLAFLHQKEIVLNRADTANLLQAVDILRSLDANLLGRIAGMVAGMVGVRFTGQTERSDSLEQNVHIDAHFPNVSAANEIQEAFNQLINDIGQKMYQNKK